MLVIDQFIVEVETLILEVDSLTEGCPSLRGTCLLAMIVRDDCISNIPGDATAGIGLEPEIRPLDGDGVREATRGGVVRRGGGCQSIGGCEKAGGS